MHACALKILGLAIPIHASAFPQDLSQLVFKHQTPLKTAYAELLLQETVYH